MYGGAPWHWDFRVCHSWALLRRSRRCRESEHGVGANCDANTLAGMCSTYVQVSARKLVHSLHLQTSVHNLSLGSGSSSSSSNSSSSSSGCSSSSGSSSYHRRQHQPHQDGTTGSSIKHIKTVPPGATTKQIKTVPPGAKTKYIKTQPPGTASNAAKPYHPKQQQRQQKTTAAGANRDNRADGCEHLSGTSTHLH